MRLPKNVGMSPNHFVVDFADYVRNRKAASLLRDLRMEYDLQEQVAHFLRELGIVAALERFQDFVRFLNQIGSQRFVSLFAIPGTAIGCTQFRLHGHELLKPLARRRSLPLRWFSVAALRILSILCLFLAATR